MLLITDSVITYTKDLIFFGDEKKSLQTLAAARGPALAALAGAGATAAGPRFLQNLSRLRPGPSRGFWAYTSLQIQRHFLRLVWTFYLLKLYPVLNQAPLRLTLVNVVIRALRWLQLEIEILGRNFKLKVLVYIYYIYSAVTPCQERPQKPILFII